MDVARVLVKCLDRRSSGVMSFSVESGSPLGGSLNSSEQVKAELDLAEQLAKLEDKNLELVPL